jgi:hypothetical protein
MRIGKLWRHRWPLVRWGLFLAALATVAAGLYAMLPPEPRWTVTCTPQWVFQTADGRIATYGSQSGSSGGLQLWDTATGCELARFLTGDETVAARGRSDDGRFLVALVKGDRPDTWRIRGVDLAAQREWDAEVAAGPFESASFSRRRCELVSLRITRTRNVGAHNLIVDTTSGRVVAKLPGDAETVVFGDDCGYVAAGYREEDQPSQTRIVNTRTGKTTVIEDARLLTDSPDSRWLLIDRGEEGTWLWDVAGASWHAHLPELKVPTLRKDIYAIHRSYTWLAVHSYNSRIIRARATRSYMGGIKIRRAMSIWYDTDAFSIGNSNNPTFSPDSRFLLCEDSPERGHPQWALYDVAAGKRLWTRAWDQNHGEPLFTPNSRRIVVHLPNSAKVEIIDAATGEVERTIDLTGMESPSIRLTSDGRTLVASATPSSQERPWLLDKLADWFGLGDDGAPMQIRTFDVDSGTAVGEFHVEECEDHWLTGDRQFLVTIGSDSDEDGTTGKIVRCWDVPPRKPLRWVLGAPACLGVALLSLRFGGGRLRLWRAARKASKNGDGKARA